MPVRIRTIASPLAPILFGPMQALRVAATYQRAVYLTDGACWISLVAPGAVLPPDGLRLDLDDDLTTRFPKGATVCIGQGRLLALESETIACSRQTRFWIPTLRHGPPVPLQSLRQSGALVRALSERVPSSDPLLTLALPRIAALHRELVSALGESRCERAKAAATALAGLGPGLTPLGDDVLAGTLLALHLFSTDPSGPSWAPCARELAASAAPRTTPRSAAWLRLAGRGAFAREYILLAEAFRCGKMRLVATLLEHVQRIGSSSGWGVTYGFLATCQGLQPLVERFTALA